MTALYIILGVIALYGIVFLGILFEERDRKKYRVVQNALGKFNLQSYEYIAPRFVSDYEGEPRRKWQNYDYVTIKTFDTLEEASSECLRLLELDRREREEASRNEMKRRSLEMERELSERVVKVYKF